MCDLYLSLFFRRTLSLFFSLPHRDFLSLVFTRSFPSTVSRLSTTLPLPPIQTVLFYQIRFAGFPLSPPPRFLIFLPENPCVLDQDPPPGTGDRHVEIFSFFLP